MEIKNSGGEDDREAIAQAVIDARILAQQIVSQANVTAAKIVAGAFEELGRPQDGIPQEIITST
jgi:hypothetical protein